MNSSTEINFIISCDTPLITIEMIEYLIDFKTEKLIRRVGAEIISAKSLAFYKEEIFFNMNDNNDYNLLLEILNSTEQK